ncbi:hypothetical protein ABTK13_21520, partial [Acinetobacter baumannii]
AKIDMARFARLAVPAAIDRHPFSPEGTPSVIQLALKGNLAVRGSIFNVDDAYLNPLTLPQLRGLACELKIMDSFDYDPTSLSRKQV